MKNDQNFNFKERKKEITLIEFRFGFILAILLTNYPHFNTDDILHHQKAAETQ